MPLIAKQLGGIASATVALATAVAAFAGVNPDGQGPLAVNVQPVKDLLDLAETRRIDVVCLGDSNQLFSGVGWQDGLTIALGEHYPMYATPILGAGANNAIGVALNTTADVSLPPTGAPAGLLPFDDPSFGVDATPYGFLPAGATIPAGSNIGMRLRPGNSAWDANNFNADHAMRVRFDYGTVDAASGAVFTPQAQQNGSFNILHPAINPATGAFGIASSFIDIPAGARNGNDINFRWFGSGAPDGAGPVHALYMRFEDLDESAGQSVHTLYGVGGATARDCAVALFDTPDEQLRLFFENVRRLQPSPARVLVRISFGANDLTDDLPSVGPDGPFPPKTDAAVADNFRAIMDRINQVWIDAGWDPDELTFLLIGCHDRLEPEPEGYGFRQAIADVALDAPNIAFVNHYRLASHYFLIVNGWYALPTGAHLEAIGYEGMCRWEVETLRQSIAADLNGDCNVDTADLGLMLAVFGSAGPLGDLNNDGVVDTADLGSLIGRFGASCVSE
ncbi:MAG: hypothetical protein H6814_00435 [Phycisphaeraceae bacterium]|nr:hypothetical protein [Phycisphaeraceae bacterium]